MLVDEVELTFKAGHGGPGKVSFFKVSQRGPDGGNGGRGGDVFIKATSDLTALRSFLSKKQIQAENGEAGGSNDMDGLNGKDVEVILPVGSMMEDTETGDIIELKTPDEVILLCKGGLGGRGNTEFKSSRNTTPKYAQPGLEGEEKHFKIHLKLIADFGLIGLPNAGKSSLLNELTKANVKTADYPFTTLEPNLGTIHRKIIADIPGLIEGASEGKGLGIKFLKHIEKVSTLLHCIAADSESPLADYETVWTELDNYSPIFKDKPEIILLTKSDLVDEKQLKLKTKELKKLKKEILPISIHDWDSIEELRKILV